MSIRDLLTKFGVHDAASGDVVTELSLHNEDQLKELLDTGLPLARRAEQAHALLDGITAPADNQYIALLHKLIRYAVGGGELSAADRAALAPAFPLSAHVFAAAPTDPPMKVDYAWNVSTPDGKLKVIDLPNGLELLDGGCIVARSTPLRFSCTSLVRTGAPPAGYQGDFNILGKKGEPVGTPKTPGAADQAAPGANGECNSWGTAGNGGGPGSPGDVGATGGHGEHGNPGIPSSIAAITVSASLDLTGAKNGLLVVATQSGPGGDGGDGGQGGPGQQGGNGGPGRYCGCTGNGGGNAGQGGKGGTGGQAGDGGDGTDTDGNITVYVPAGVHVDVVQPLPIPAPPGEPGHPGPGGTGGLPGTPGAAGKDNSAGSAAGSNGTGDQGPVGNRGTHIGLAAQVFVYNF